MSLQVWLPLNKFLENKGTSNAIFTGGGSISYTATGKVTLYSGQFNGSNSYIYGNVDLTANMTYACWIKFAATGSYHIIDNRAPSGETGYQPMYGGTTYGLQCYSSNGGSYTWSAATCGFTTNTWYHLAVVITPSNATLYINGVSKGTQAGNFGTNFGTRQMRLGTRCSGANWFNGYLNDVRVYNEALSVKEIKELAKGLCLHYKFNFEDMYFPLSYVYSSASSSPACYIDTGITSGQNITRIEAHYTKVNNTTKQILFGMYTGSGSGYSYMDYRESGSTYTCCWYGTTVDSGVTMASNQDIKSILEVNGKNFTYTVNGTSVSGVSNGTPSGSTHFYLFADNSNGSVIYPFICQLRSFKIWVDGELARDFVPCIRKIDDNVVGLYDLVNGAFYASSGSALWPSPLEYTNPGTKTVGWNLVDYIEFNGAQCFEANITSLTASNFRIEIDFQRFNTDTADSCLFGQRQFGKFTNIYNGYYESAYGNTASGTAADTNRHTLVMDPTGIYKDGTLLLSNTISAISSSYSALIGAFSEDSYSNAKWFYKGRLYHLTITDNGTVVRDFYPALHGSNGPALYDAVSDRIFTPVYPNTVTSGQALALQAVRWPDLIDPTTTDGSKQINTLSATISSAENKITLSGTNAWGSAGITSKDSWNRCVVQATVDQNTSYIMIGVAPVNNSYNYTQGYFIYPSAEGRYHIYELGTHIGDFGAYSANDTFKVGYNGTTVIYYVNGNIVRSVAASGKMYMNITAYNAGVIKNVWFGNIEQVDSNVIDSSGYNNYGVPSVNIGTANDLIIGNGTGVLNNKWLIANPTSMPQYMDKMSVFMWIKEAVPTTQRFIFGTFNSWPANGIGWWADSGSSSVSNLVKVVEASSYTNGTSFGAVCDGTWHHIGVTWDGTYYKTYKDGTLLGTVQPTSAGRIYNPVWYIGGALYNNEKMDGKLADVRVYASALSQEDITELYKTKESIDSSGNIFCNTYKEDTSSKKVDFQKKSIIETTGLAESITLDDGSIWVPISVHYIPNGVFANSGDFTTLNSQGANKWTNFGLINSAERPESGYYEFMCRQQTATTGPFKTYRWKQTTNPFNASWADVNPSVSGTSGTKVIWISPTSAATGGMYWFNSSNCKMCFANSSNGNWFGCGVCSYWGTGYIPSYNNEQCWGYQIVYMRVKKPIAKILKNKMIEAKGLREN